MSFLYTDIPDKYFVILKGNTLVVLRAALNLSYSNSWMRYNAIQLNTNLVIPQDIVKVLGKKKHTKI